MPEVDERRTAVHEAGHVVVAHAEGVGIQRVTIDHDEAGEGAGAVWHDEPTEPTEDDLTALGRIAWAGSVAESLVFDSALRSSWGLDANRQVERAKEHGEKAGPLYFGEDEKEAARQVLQANRHALDEVTRLLLRHRTVDGEQLTVILDGLIP